MKMKKTVAFLLVLVLAASSALAGCSTTGKANSTGGAASSPASASASAGTKVLNVNIGAEPTNFDPNDGIGDSLMFTNSLIYEGITRLDENNNAVPGMATSWEVSKDGLTYTFHIRKDNKWSDGTVATAADYEYGIKRIIQGKTGVDWAMLVYDIKNAAAANEGKVSIDKVGIHANGDTLTIELEKPEAYFPKLLTFSPYFGVSQKFVESTKKYGTEANSTIGNGPYYVASWEHNDKVVLKKNPYYWNKDAIKIDQINCYMIADENTAINMFNNGELDIIDFSGSKKAAVEASGKKVQTYNSGRSGYLEVNQKDPILSNKKVRQALSSAIDRNLYISGVLKDGSQPATGFVPNGISGAENKDFRQIAGSTLVYNYDSAKAKALLDEGLKELGLKKENVKLTILAKDGDIYRTGSAALQQMFQNELGIKIEVQSLDSASYSAKRYAKEYQLTLVSWGADWDDASTFLTYYNGKPAASTPYTYYSEAYTDIYSKAAVETDASKRINELVQAEKILMEDLPIIPIYFSGQYYTVADKVQGISRRAVVPYLDTYRATVK